MSTTVGIDMAAEPAGTSIVAVAWNELGSARVGDVHVGCPDDLVRHWMCHPDRTIGIDCPLGWPVAFADLVAGHRDGTYRPAEYYRPSGWRREYTLRATDRFVHETTGLTPLSVSADKIGSVAIRTAALMADVSYQVDVRKDGSGALIEVYPAASLMRWGLSFRGYKKSANRRNLGRLVDELVQAAPWLDLGHAERAIRSSDDAFDALVCALTARAAHAGACFRPENLMPADAANQEGWIHLPMEQLPGRPWQVRSV